MIGSGLPRFDGEVHRRKITSGTGVFTPAPLVAIASCFLIAILRREQTPNVLCYKIHIFINGPYAIGPYV